MAIIGKTNQLIIMKRTIHGLFLDGGELGEILLPKRFVPENFSVGEALEVFLYLDSEDRLIATTLKPYAQVGDFAYLKLKSVESVGAFMDWGLDKDLFVHHSEQTRDIVTGESYLVYIYLDESNRISASMKTNRFLKPAQPTEKITEKTTKKTTDELNNKRVPILIYSKTDLGYKAIVNNEYDGLLYHSEIFEDLKPGVKTEAYINKIRPDGKIDLILKNASMDSIDEIAVQILEALAANSGAIKLNDKSSSEQIANMFKVSRKKFKVALAGLYSKRLVKVTASGIELVKKS